MQASRCFGSTKGPYKVASLDFTFKELLGGLDFWMRDQQPPATGAKPGHFLADAPTMAKTCAC